MTPSGCNGVRVAEGKPAVSVTGTVVALISTHSSGAAYPGQAGVGTWGGARNRADRVSFALTRAQVENTIDAAWFAFAAGVPFNRHITVHWQHAGIPDEGAAAATGGLIKLMSQFLQKRGERFAYVWVRENDEGDGQKGSHVHILAYVRPTVAAAFTAMQRRWLRRITGKPYRAGTIHTARIGGTVRAATAAPEVYRVNLVKIVAYVVKGAAADLGAELGLERCGEGGRVTGKRASRSQLLRDGNSKYNIRLFERDALDEEFRTFACSRQPGCMSQNSGQS